MSADDPDRDDVDPVDPDDEDLAAAEYVLGTLSADARARFDAALVDDGRSQAAVYAWQDRLLDLVERVAPVEPSTATWSAIERRIAPQAMVAAANDSFWNRVATWRATTGLAMAASVVLAATLAVQPASRDAIPVHARYLAVLQSPTEKVAGWLVEAVADEGVRLVPVGRAVAAPPGKVLQFWTKPLGAASPTSLGLVRAGEIAAVPVARLPTIGERQLFEVTLEPDGGSTTGRPTGPVLFVGTTVAL